MSQVVKREKGGGVAWPWNVRNQMLDQIGQGGGSWGKGESTNPDGNRRGGLKLSRLLTDPNGAK
jgi:hypothetical protein